MSGMKNLKSALDELHRAETNLLAAAGWHWVIDDQYVSRQGEQLPHDQAVAKVKSNWKVKEAS